MPPQKFCGSSASACFCKEKHRFGGANCRTRAAQASESLLGFALPYPLYLALPYAMAIVALVLVARRAAYPQALMKPYRKGER